MKSEYRDVNKHAQIFFFLFKIHLYIAVKN